VTNVHVDPSFDDDERRTRLYAGELIVYSRVPEVAEFVDFARNLLTEALGPDNPTSVHNRRTPEDLAELLIRFKPRFIHHPESINHVRRITEALGACPLSSYADVPKMRTAFPVGGLSSGIAYAFQAHRDTWYGAPPQQINWWMPIWPVATNNAMEFYPSRFGQAVDNNSDRYNYYVANQWRGRIKEFSGGRDTRVHPAPQEPIDSSEHRICLVPPVGGIMIFSGDQLHATIPNVSRVTRYSIDFRTLSLGDLRSRTGAPVADRHCTGTSLRDFHRLTDRAELTEADIAPYDSEDADTLGVKVFVPS
jgi:hypothetical protein